MTAENQDRTSGGIQIAPGVRVPESTLRFSFTRGSGPGGQNVNKLATQVELRLTVEDLVTDGGLSQAAANRLRRLAGSRLTKDDEIIVVSAEHRTQGQNRRACLEKLRELLIQARIRPKKRIPTKPSRAAKERRLKQKKERSEIKAKRGRIKPP